jgi:osmotically inducible protein OsmC
MESRATATWEGDLVNGHGTASAASGVFKNAGLSWKARTEGAASHTTPEELLAASHAGCFSMALSHALAQAGKPATKLETTCVVTFGPKSGGGFEVKSSRLTVKGRVPGLEAAKFSELAEGAKNGCPISGIMKNNVEMSVEAQLEG